jgi:hypothetical protein
MSSRTNRKDVLGEAMHRAFEGTPVRDAKVDLRVMLVPEDFDGAVRNDPAFCLFARASMRIYRTDMALFYKQFAYLKLPDDEGIEHVERFVIGQTMRDIIAAFDRGDPVSPNACFTLRAPTPSRKIDGRKGGRKRPTREQERERSRVRRERRRLERSLRGDSGDSGEDAATPAPGAPAGEPRPRELSSLLPRDPVVVNPAERSGQGKVNWFRKRASRARASAAQDSRR